MSTRSGSPSPATPSKTCITCGRSFSWRAKWRDSWDEVRYCSDACRRQRLDDTDLALETAIGSLLAARAGGATICPSEAARAVGRDDWRPLMERARRAARRMQARGEVVIVQGGRPVDPDTAKGPIRIRRVSR